jgi:hypothetical protein
MEAVSQAAILPWHGGLKAAAAAAVAAAAVARAVQPASVIAVRAIALKAAVARAAIVVPHPRHHVSLKMDMITTEMTSEAQVQAVSVSVAARARPMRSASSLPLMGVNRNVG